MRAFDSLLDSLPGLVKSAEQSTGGASHCLHEADQRMQNSAVVMLPEGTPELTVEASFLCLSSDDFQQHHTQGPYVC